MTNKIRIENHAAVRVLRINRPDVRNCVDGETAEAIGKTIEGFRDDDSARVLIITGAGDLAFCAGADLKHTQSLLSHRYVDSGSPMGFARLDPGKPVIAAIEGFCFAGGFEFASWCDFRIASETAEFGCLSRRWGVPYVDGGTQRFARIMGLGNALYLMQTGVRINVQRAMQLGFVQEITPAGGAFNRALKLATAMAGYPNFEGLCAERAAVQATWGVALDEGLALEARSVRKTLESAEMQAGLARFSGGARDTSPTPPQDKTPS